VKLKTLFHEFHLRDLWTNPFSKKDGWPDGFWPHIWAHVLGGIAVWIIALLWIHAVTHSWLITAAFWSNAIFHALWQFILEETHTTQGMKLPLWSMIWDIVIPVCAAGIIAGVISCL